MTDVVGSASFELRATRDKIPADLEAARREIEAAAKRTEDALAEIVGTGTAKGAKKAAEALKEPQAAGIEAGSAISESMRKAGEETAASITAGARKAKQELDELQRKAREVQPVVRPTPTIPTEATHRLDTNPLNGVQSWVPLEATKAAPALKETAERAKEAGDALKDIKPASEMGADGLGRVSAGAVGTGIAIGALIGGAVLVGKALWDMGRAAMESAAQVEGSAKKIGVSTDTLQEFRYVAMKLGEDAGSADRALTSFADKVHLAASKISKEAVADFAQLRITPEQLKSFKSTEEALEFVISRIEDLSSESDRAAIAERLGLGPLAVALRGNAGEIARLRDEAQRLGVVMDAELVRRGAEAQGQFETLSRVIDVQLKSAFIDLAPAISAAIGLVSELATALNDAFQSFKSLDDRTTSHLRRRDNSLASGQSVLMEQYGSRAAMDGQMMWAPPGTGEIGLIEAGSAFDRWQRQRVDIGTELMDRPATPVSAPGQNNRPGSNLAPRPGRSDNSGQREAEREARRAERVQEEINRLKARELGIAQGDLLTVQQRYDLRQRELEIARAGEDADLQSRLARGDLIQANFNEITAQNAINRGLEDRIAADLAFRDMQDERLAQERVMTDLTADLLSLQSGAARTIHERREVELRLLAMAQQRAREEMDLRHERENTPAARRTEERATLDAVFRAQTSSAERNNQTPLEQWRDQALKTSGEIDEALENIAARGLDALNDGIVDAIMNSRSLGEVFSNVAKSIIADLARIAVRMSITEPLARTLFGGGSSGGSGWLGSFLNFGSQAAGTSMPGAGGGGLLPGRLMGLALPDVTSSIGKGLSGASSMASQAVNVVIGVNDDRFNAYVDGRAGPLADNAYGRAMTDAPKLTMAQTAKQQSNAVGRRRR